MPHGLIRQISSSSLCVLSLFVFPLHLFSFSSTTTSIISLISHSQAVALCFCGLFLFCFLFFWTGWKSYGHVRSALSALGRQGVSGLTQKSFSPRMASVTVPPWVKQGVSTVPGSPPNLRKDFFKNVYFDCAPILHSDASNEFLFLYCTTHINL